MIPLWIKNCRNFWFESDQRKFMNAIMLAGYTTLKVVWKYCYYLDIKLKISEEFDDCLMTDLQLSIYERYTINMLFFFTGTFSCPRSYNQEYKWGILCRILLHLFPKIYNNYWRILLPPDVWMVRFLFALSFYWFELNIFLLYKMQFMSELREIVFYKIV